MRMLCIVIAGLAVAACGGPQAESGEARDAEAHGGVIGEDYVDALDRAGSVDELARERKDRLDEAVDDSD